MGAGEVKSFADGAVRNRRPLTDSATVTASFAPPG
jgi:hypothetical protein